MTAPRIQDTFKNIVSSPYQAPTSVSAPSKQYLAWETVSRENIHILNHVFWFKSAMEKATTEMFSEVDKMKDSVDHGGYTTKHELFVILPAFIIYHHGMSR